MVSSAAAVSIDKVAIATRNGSIGGTVLLAERNPQRPSLWVREVLTQPHHRQQQPMQGRERQRRLGLQPLGAQDQRLACVGDQRFEEGRLADTGLAVDDQAGRGPVAGLLEEPGQVRGLEVAADKHAVTVLPRTAQAVLETRPFDRGDAAPELGGWERPQPDAATR